MASNAPRFLAAKAFAAKVLCHPYVGELLDWAYSGRIPCRDMTFATSDLIDPAELTDSNGARDVFVRDMDLGTTVCVSVNTTGSFTGNRPGCAGSALPGLHPGGGHGRQRR